MSDIRFNVASLLKDQANDNPNSTAIKHWKKHKQTFHPITDYQKIKKKRFTRLDF